MMCVHCLPTMGVAASVKSGLERVAAQTSPLVIGGLEASTPIKIRSCVSNGMREWVSGEGWRWGLYMAYTLTSLFQDTYTQCSCVFVVDEVNIPTSPPL
ncbi:hypothetical protein EON65_42385, partial [archaeon]